MLGTVYPVEFYNDIKDNRIRDPLCRITEESQEDLEKYENVLKQFGCEVIRCNSEWEGDVTAGGKYTFKGNEEPVNSLFTTWNQGKPIPRNALQPRDGHFVAGNTLVHTCKDNKGIWRALLSLKPERYLIHPSVIQGFNSIFDAPAVTIVGKDLYFDPIGSTFSTEKGDPVEIQSGDTTLEIPRRNWQGSDAELAKHFKRDILDWLQRNLPEFRTNTVTIGGHSDGCFHTLKEGVIISLHDIQDYEKTFPGWEVCYLPDQSWDAMEPFIKMKNQYPKTAGKWWVPGEESNEAFINFVETWLGEWVGYVEETVFGVNVLVLDEHHVCIADHKQKNKQFEEFLKKHKIEPVYVPWRHRYFWDGGLHCITLDLVREGTQQNYFPERDRQE